MEVEEADLPYGNHLRVGFKAGGSKKGMERSSKAEPATYILGFGSSRGEDEAQNLPRAREKQNGGEGGDTNKGARGKLIRGEGALQDVTNVQRERDQFGTRSKLHQKVGKENITQIRGEGQASKGGRVENVEAGSLMMGDGSGGLGDDRKGLPCCVEISRREDHPIGELTCMDFEGQEGTPHLSSQERRREEETEEDRRNLREPPKGGVGGARIGPGRGEEISADARYRGESSTLKGEGFKWKRRAREKEGREEREAGEMSKGEKGGKRRWVEQGEEMDVTGDRERKRGRISTVEESDKIRLAEAEKLSQPRKD